MSPRICENGTTLVNLITVLAITGILAGTAITSFRELSDPLANASFSVEHFVRLVRSHAISSTRAITISPGSDRRLIARTGESCEDTEELSENLFIDLPRGARFSDTTWSVCFTARGFAAAGTSFELLDNTGVSRTVSIALGGGTRVSNHE